MSRTSENTNPAVILQPEKVLAPLSVFGASPHYPGGMAAIKMTEPRQKGLPVCSALCFFNSKYTKGEK